MVKYFHRHSNARKEGETVRFCLVVSLAPLLGACLFGLVSAPPLPAEGESGSAPPTIIWTFPSNADSKIPVDVTIRIVFSTGMDRPTVESALWLDPDFPRAVVWINSSELNVKPVGSLAHFSDYRFIVNTTAMDLNGSALQANPWVTFFTSKAPDPIHVVRTMPAHQARDVPESTTVTITFSRPMDHASTLAAFRSLPSFEASLTWIVEGDGESLIIVPVRELETYQSYNFYIDFSARSADGERLGDDFYFVFQISPLRYYAGLAIGAIIVLALLIGVPILMIRRAQKKHERTLVSYMKMYRRASLKVLASRTSASQFAIRHVMRRLIASGALLATWDPGTSEFVLSGGGEQRAYETKCPHCGGMIAISLMSGEQIICPFCKSLVGSVTMDGSMRRESP